MGFERVSGGGGLGALEAADFEALVAPEDGLGMERKKVLESQDQNQD